MADEGIFSMMDDIEEQVQTGTELTQWEADFITNMNSRRESKRDFTPKQRLAIVSVWEKYDR